MLEPRVMGFELEKARGLFFKPGTVIDCPEGSENDDGHHPNAADPTTTPFRR